MSEREKVDNGKHEIEFVLVFPCTHRIKQWKNTETLFLLIGEKKDFWGGRRLFGWLRSSVTVHRRILSAFSRKWENTTVSPDRRTFPKKKLPRTSIFVLALFPIFTKNVNNSTDRHQVIFYDWLRICFVLCFEFVFFLQALDFCIPVSDDIIFLINFLFFGNCTLCESAKTRWTLMSNFFTC